MTNMVDFVNERVSSVSYNESLASILKDMILDTKKKPFVGDYYNLTDLCNPAHTYWTRISPKVEKTISLQKKFEWGNKLHELAQKWIETFPDFVVSEGTLDGTWVDLPGVRGRIDCRVGESIFEIKTKEKIPENPEQLILDYPQDVEQISFYSALHPSHDKINYLIFIKDSSPFELKAFKIEIKDLSRIKSLMELRMKILNESIKEKNPIPLGRCRYYGKECQFQKENMCNCEKLELLSTKQLEQAINITYDEEMTKKLEETRKKFNSSKKFFSTKDVISPRKYNLNEEWDADKDKSSSQAFLMTLVKKLPLGLSLEERKILFKSSQEPRLHVSYRWANLKNSGEKNSNIVPYIIKANMTSSIQTRPHEYFIAELGIVSSTYNKMKGLIFIISPNKNNFVQVFEVTYKRTNEILNKTKEIIDKLDKGEKDILTFPPCPNFMNNKRTCKLMKECHSKEGAGCVEG